MRMVMVAKQKGGAGATTLARELGVAAAAAAAGKRVVFVDLDPQGTLRGWWNRRTEGAQGDPNPGLATPTPDQMPAALDQLRAAGMDLCVVDTPPSVHPFLGAVMRLADGSVKNLGRYAASWTAGWPNRPSSTAALT